MAACCSEQASSSSGNVTKKSPAAAAKSVCWQHRLFGKQLSRCSQVNQQDTKPCDASGMLVDEDGRPTCEVIGVYFSFINPGATCDDFTRQLLDLYTNVNLSHTENDRDAENSSRGRERRKKFEVVHVVLWSNVADVLDFEESFRAHVSELPWLAVPNLDYERKVKFTAFISFFSFDHINSIYQNIFRYNFCCISILSIFFLIYLFYILTSIICNYIKETILKNIVNVSQYISTNIYIFYKFFKITLIISLIIIII